MTLNSGHAPTPFSPAREASVAPSLLVVDDDAIQRRIIGKLGRQAGFAIMESPSVVDATQILHSHRMDCATIDLSLGEQSGLELISTIARISPRILVLIISGRSEETLNASKKFAIESGLSVHETFPKPLNLSGVRDSLLRAAQKLDPAYP